MGITSDHALMMCARTSSTQMPLSASSSQLISSASAHSQLPSLTWTTSPSTFPTQAGLSFLSSTEASRPLSNFTELTERTSQRDAFRDHSPSSQLCKLCHHYVINYYKNKK